jgi:hypothetical protein
MQTVQYVVQVLGTSDPAVIDTPPALPVLQPVSFGEQAFNISLTP